MIKINKSRRLNEKLSCRKCEYPYHGEACDRCGENGNCEHGVCIETEIGNIMSGEDFIDFIVRKAA